MGKKSSSLSLIYLIGMALVVIGFIIPMFKFKVAFFSGTQNGFDFINFDHFGFVTIGALLIFVGACLGVVFSLAPVGSKDLLKLICLVASIAGGIVLVVGFTQDSFYKFGGKQLLKAAYIGFYMIIVGWVVGLAGYITKK